MKYTVLIAEDDGDIIRLLQLYLDSAGYRVLTAGNGTDAVEIIKNEHIDAALLDIMMPGLDGYEVVRQIRALSYKLPVLIISAKNRDSDKILGLTIGADDYITKPFNPLEVVARVGAQLRRYYELTSADAASSENMIRIGELELNTESLELRKRGEEIIITPHEYKILLLLMRSPGRVFTKSQICEAMNGEFYENYENTISVHISHLRDKIEDDARIPKYIKNVRGIGYKIEKL